MTPATSRIRPAIGRTSLLLAVCAVFMLGMTARAEEETLSKLADRMKTKLAKRILPYWFDKAQDKVNGAYLLADDGSGHGEARDKQLVTQSRMIWGFSHAHLNGYGDDKHDYLKAAEQGYRFLQAHFYDAQNGGYYWKTDLAGKPTVDCKFLYGESFVVYALVEYYRAGGDKEALRHAMDLYHKIQEKFHDARNKGWREHGERDWKPLKPDDERNEVELIGKKSANTHLHWMEALTELYDATHDPAVKESLAEALKLNMTWFYPSKPGFCSFHRQNDWQEVLDPKSAGLSYGHNVEFAWLMLRAQNTLDVPLSWDHFYAHLDHALKNGVDHKGGGVYSRGFDDHPATERDKVWWVQAEMLAALTEALKHKPDARCESELHALLDYIDQYQSAPGDGIWYDTLNENNTVKTASKAHNWKANYHDVRAMEKFVKAFSSKP